ncbi:MAG: endolytic transglycosylase MltG [Actinomycetota bacterium]
MLEPSTVRDRQPRRRALLVLGILAVVMLLVIGGAGGYYLYATGASGDQEAVSLEIPEGSTTSQIADLLEERDVIRSALMFRVMARFRGLGGSIEAGRYELTTNMSLNAVFDTLGEGPVPIPTVTFGFPEGLRVDQVADRAAEQLGFTRKAFLNAANGELSLSPYLPESAETLEGFLFPKVYEFFPNPKPRAVIERMLQQFRIEAADLPWSNAEALGVSPYQVVTIASLIEREARVEPDRAKIARVIYNRLAEDHPLEIDATIQYCLRDNRPILLVEREIDCAHNTYGNAGVPPTPIASPGRASLEAALSPAEGDWFFYVVIDCDTGEHGFADKEDGPALFASAPSCFD